MTRKQYLDAPDQAAAHRIYYTQFVTPSIIARVVREFGLPELQQALAKDPHFNTIPLRRWDRISHLDRSVHDAMQAQGDYVTANGAVCILKEAARQAVETAPSPTGVEEGLAVKERAKIDGSGWRNRHPSPDVAPSEQTIRNHFSMSWSHQQLGTAPDKSIVWPIYRETFIKATEIE